MASATMAPPPSLLAHRRTRPSVPSAGTSSCIPRKMSLPKADTFHQPSSPATADDPVLSIAHLCKRSTTCTRSSFTNWLYSEREAAADVIADFEKTFSGARGPRPATRRQSQKAFQDLLSAKQQQRAASPVDSGLGSSIGSPSEKSLSRALDKALELSSVRDSAIGASVSASVHDSNPSEELIQGWLARSKVICASSIDLSAETNSNSDTQTRRSSNTHHQELKIIRYPIPPRNSTLPFLDNRARRQIYRSLFSPLLNDSRFEEFKGIVAGTRKNKSLRCLRDIEQALIKQPVVSTVYPLTRKSSNTSNKTLSVTASKYKSFGELTIQLVVDTHQQLSENEQRRSTDRAYDNGYFLDLVQQVQQLAAHIGSSDTTIENGEQPTIDDEITLEGGLAESGNLAELVRWKDGQGISLRTGLPYVPMAGMKRGASNVADDAQFSARRKKGVVYPEHHLPCSEPGCDKVFSRQCDLGKHEKTHSRPFKCPEPSCKFHEIGLPTEKELDRHKNDKHNAAPTMYRCRFCEFQTKRESNCKQHMEKKHNWTYHRSKGRDKAAAMTPKSTPKTPAVGYSVEPSPSSEQPGWDNQSAASFQSPYQQGQDDFALNEGYPRPLFPHVSGGAAFDFNAPIDMSGPSSAGGNMYGQNMTNGMTNGIGGYPTPASGVMHNFATPQTPAYSNITPSPMLTMDHSVGGFNGCINDLPTPESMQAHSRQVSLAQDMQFMTQDTTLGMDFTFDDLDNANMMSDFQVIESGAFTREGAGNATLFPEVNSLGGEQEFMPEHFSIHDNMSFDDDSLFHNY